MDEVQGMSYGMRENATVKILRDVKNVGSYGTLNVKLAIVILHATSALNLVQLT